MPTAKSTPNPKELRIAKDALTFDDVLLQPGYSEVLPREVDLSTRLTSEITLSIPILSAAMDTVTESDLAIALAREGGLGVIHRNCGIEKQAGFVARVKRSESMVILDPITVSPDLTMEEVETIMHEKGVSGFPVVGADGKLEGMMTTRDMWLIESRGTKVKEVMTPRDRLVTSPPETLLEEATKILYRSRIEKLPLVDEEGKLAGTIRSEFEWREDDSLTYELGKFRAIK